MIIGLHGKGEGNNKFQGSGGWKKNKSRTMRVGERGGLILFIQ